MSACPACSTENPAVAKFCIHCGESLPVLCPACQTPAPAGARFCMECGTALSTTSSTRSSSPEPPSVTGEKKHITVLFADVAGSMDLQERLDAEVWAQIMGRFVSILAEGVRKFGGTVDKFTGDGIMALFGAPVAQEDHARRACHAAWHLTKAIGELSEELRRTHDVDLQVRLGLNSGEVVVGRVGDDVTLDPTALGHTVGLAQRMEAMAEPGKAYLAEHTARLVEGWFHLEGLGGRRVKGATDPLNVHVLGAPLPSPARRTVGAAPLVGRGREVAVLEDALDMAVEGQFQVVGVVGEAGVGKSRLCDEFAQSVSGRGLTVRRASGVSHGRDVPLLPILSFQREYFGILDSDDPASARRKVTERLLDLDPELEEALPVLFDFLEIPDPDRPVPAMAAEARMRRVFDIVRRITARRSERETLVLIFEDLHLFDPQSDAFLERLIESYPGSRTLVVANFRPECSARWMRHSYYRQLPLAPLHEQAVTELLGGLLGVDLSLAPLVSFILDRTGGNPFFVEELVRALVEDGALTGDRGRYRLMRPLHQIRVPPSVQSVLAARVDRLPPEHKMILQTASVIGRTFDTDVLAAVTGSRPEELQSALSALCSAELLQESRHEPTMEHRFWHPLTQEVTYGSMLADRRRDLHAAVAQAVRQSAGDRLEEQAAVLAWHWERAGRPSEAAGWNLRAGEWALRTDLQEAERRWRTAIEQVDRAAETAGSVAVGIQARMRLIQYGARRGIDPGEAERLYAEARTLAERSQDQRLLILTTMLHGSVAFFAGEHGLARARYSDAVRLADAIDDPELRTTVRTGLSVELAYNGPLSECITVVDEIIGGCAGDPDLGANLMGFGLLALGLERRAEYLGLVGRLENARPLLEEALRMVRRRGDPEILAWTLAAVPWLNFFRGDTEDHRALAREALQIAEDTANIPTRARALVAFALAELAVGEPDGAAAACERALGEAEETRSARLEQANALAILATAQLLRHNTGAAIAAADGAVNVARRQEARVLEPLTLLVRARARRVGEASGDPCEGDLRDAMTVMKTVGAYVYEPFIWEELGRLHDDDKELREALRLYRRIGATGHARRLEAELSMKATP